MLKKQIIISLILFLASVVNFAQSDFEGNIKFKITSDGDDMSMNYLIKGESLRMEIVGNDEASFIYGNGKTYILMPSEKMYMDLDNSIFSKIPGMMNTDDKNDNNNEDEEININSYKTGKTMTILGYECEQWIFKDEEDDEQVEAWVTDELGNFMFMKSPMGAGYSPGWSSSLENNGFFPMLVITKDEDGEVTSRFEATEVNKKSLSSDLFSPPSDYKEMKIPGM